MQTTKSQKVAVFRETGDVRVLIRTLPFQVVHDIPFYLHGDKPAMYEVQALSVTVETDDASDEPPYVEAKIMGLPVRKNGRRIDRMTYTVEVIGPFEVVDVVPDRTTE